MKKISTSLLGIAAAILVMTGFANGQAGAAPAGGTNVRNIPAPKIGDVAPDFEQYDVDGKPVKLSDFRGKYVLLDFWRSNCAPCRKQHPHLIKLYEKYKNQGFVILGVSTDFEGDKAKWLKAMEQDKITWPNVANYPAGLAYGDKVKLPAYKYKVSGIPRNFLINPDGKIIGIDLKGEALEKALTQVLQ